VCNAEGNYTAYCNPEVDALIDRQSREADLEKRKRRVWDIERQLAEDGEADLEKRKRRVWDIERQLAEDGAMPAIFYTCLATCRQPYVKGLTIMVNSIYNGWRMEDVWLNK
jgi:peptide/nickel transport system substrate-binding protein